MTKEYLESEYKQFNEQFHKKANMWALEQLKEISDKYNVEIRDYGIFKMRTKGSDDWLMGGELDYFVEVEMAATDIWLQLEEWNYNILAYEYSNELKMIN